MPFPVIGGQQKFSKNLFSTQKGQQKGHRVLSNFPYSVSFHKNAPVPPALIAVDIFPPVSFDVVAVAVVVILVARITVHNVF